MNTLCRRVCKQARSAAPAQAAPPASEAALVQACQALQARNRLLEHTARVAFEHGQQVSNHEVSLPQDPGHATVRLSTQASLYTASSVRGSPGAGLPGPAGPQPPPGEHCSGCL